MADPFDVSNFDPEKLRGLLSFSATPEEQQKAMTYGLIGAGLGILSANGQNPRGAGSFGPIGSGGLTGLQMYQHALTNAPRERLQNVQGMLGAQNLLKSINAQGLLTEFAKRQGGAGFQAGQQALGAEQAAGGAPGPTLSAAERIPQQTASQLPNFDLLTAGGVPHEQVKLLMESWKLRNPEMQVHNNFAYNPRTQAPGFMPGMNTSANGQTSLTQIDPTTGLPQVSAPPGALDTFRSYQDAEKRAGAQYDLVTRPPLAPGLPPTYESRLGLLPGQQAPQQQPPQQPMQAPASRVGPLRTTATNDQAAIQRVLEASRGGREASVTVQPLGSIPTGNVVNAAGMSPVQEKAVETEALRDRAINAATTEIGKQSVERLSKEADAQRGIMNTLDTVEKIVNSKEGVYGNTPIDRMAMLGHTQGWQSPKSINTQRIRELGSQLVLARGSLGSQVSNKDAEIYAKAAGDFQNAKSPADMISSVATLREIASKYFNQTNQSLDHFSKTGEIPQYQQSEPQPAQQTASAPSARPRAVNQKTGEAVEWDGKQWTPATRRAGF